MKKRADSRVILLGIDPGTLVTGYGVLESSRGEIRMVTCGVIRNHASRSMPLRLKSIYEGLEDIIDRYHPDECAIETAFYGKNAQSALKIGQARGVAILSAVLREIPTAEYSPREVKLAVTGNGAASKHQVQFMVRKLLTLRSTPKELDASDAVAVAMCHLQSSGTAVKKSHTRRKSWAAFVDEHPEKLLKAV